MADKSRLCFVSIRAKDIDASARFYREAVGVPLHQGLEYPHHEFSWHNPYFHFAIFPKSTTRQPVLAFAVDDVEAAHAKAVAAGAKVLSPPKDQPWGRTADYIDPDGNIIGLVQLREKRNNKPPASYQRRKPFRIPVKFTERDDEG